MEFWKLTKEFQKKVIPQNINLKKDFQLDIENDNHIRRTSASSNKVQKNSNDEDSRIDQIKDKIPIQSNESINNNNDEDNGIYRYEDIKYTKDTQNDINIDISLKDFLNHLRYLRNICAKGKEIQTELCNLLCKCNMNIPSLSQSIPNKGNEEGVEYEFDNVNKGKNNISNLSCQTLTESVLFKFLVMVKNRLHTLDHLKDLPESKESFKSMDSNFGNIPGLKSCFDTDEDNAHDSVIQTFQINKNLHQSEINTTVENFSKTNKNDDNLHLLRKFCQEDEKAMHKIFVILTQLLANLTTSNNDNCKIIWDYCYKAHRNQEINNVKTKEQNVSKKDYQNEFLFDLIETADRYEKKGLMGILMTIFNCIHFLGPAIAAGQLARDEVLLTKLLQLGLHKAPIENNIMEDGNDTSKVSPAKAEEEKRIEWIHLIISEVIHCNCSLILFQTMNNADIGSHGSTAIDLRSILPEELTLAHILILYIEEREAKQEDCTIVDKIALMNFFALKLDLLCNNNRWKNKIQQDNSIKSNGMSTSTNQIIDEPFIFLNPLREQAITLYLLIICKISSLCKYHDRQKILVSPYNFTEDPKENHSMEKEKNILTFCVDLLVKLGGKSDGYMIQNQSSYEKKIEKTGEMSSQVSSSKEDTDRYYNYGRKSNIIRIISNLVYQCPSNQDFLRTLPFSNGSHESEYLDVVQRNEENIETGGALPLILNHCRVDSHNPFLREWGIVCIRNICEGNAQNQAFIANLQLQGQQEHGSAGYEMLSSMGLKMTQSSSNSISIQQEKRIP